MNPSVAEIKRQLAIKEQDLLYAKQRNEKLQQEIESMKKQPKDEDLSEALRKEIQMNENLQRQLEIANQGNILERMKELEKEKNALLDYIEETLEKSAQNTERSAPGLNADKMKKLEYENTKLF